MEEEFKYDPVAEENARKYRLPFALCKSKGIPIQDWWTPRDAWEALRRGGHIDNVSEEYKEYYRNLKKEQAKSSRERSKRKALQLKDPQHNPSKDYQHQDGAIDGAVKGTPMDFKAADSGNVNPYYGKGIGYSFNCQTCVATYFARRQGYDVRALPNLNNKYIFQLSHDVSLVYVDKNGKHPTKTAKPKGERVGLFLEKNIGKNEIYTVDFEWTGKRTGHIITAERGEDGAVRLYDPQTNKIIKNSEFSKYFKSTKNIELMKLTGFEIDERFADKIMKGVNKDGHTRKD